MIYACLKQKVKSRLFLLLAMFMVPLSIFAQQRSITGEVKSQKGNTLPGVTVIARGTTIGTVTNSDGEFSLNVPADAEALQFSFVGMKTQEISINGKTNISVVMQEETIGLDEVVAIGYGTVKKGDLTGAVSTVSASDFERVPAVNPLDALQSRSPGLSITTNSGLPGSGASVQVRGVQSINGTNAPIYVVDGTITSSINNISPNDIESFTILKDASATAIYGARAANGVILVTTKRGSTTGEPVITLNTYVGLQTQSNQKLDLLNASEFLEIYTEAYENGGVTPPWDAETLKYYEGVDTDWISEIMQTGILQNYDLSVSGGNDKSNYFVSANYVDHKGMIIETDFKKYNLRFNSDHKIGDWIKFGNSLNIYATERNGLETKESPGGDGYYALAAIKVPITRAYEEDGSYGKIYNTTLEHMHQSPIWQAHNVIDNTQNKGIIGNLYLTLQLLKGLEFTTRGNLEWNHVYLTDFRSGLDPSYQWEGSTKNFIQKEGRQTLHWITDFLLDYNKTFGEDHVVKALLGYSLEENSYEDLWGSRTETPNNSIQFLDAGDPTSQLNGNSFSDWAFVSTFGRVNYTFKNKYLFTGTIRRDGTSRLASGKRFGIFPSASFAWRMSEESFMDGASFIDDLKLRASWGSVGNAQSISTYGTIATLAQWNYVLNQQQAQGYTLASAVNADLKWESSTKKNIGLDGVLLNNQVYFSADYFIEDTYDLLFRQPITASTGLAGSPFINAGQVRNTGYELDLGYRKNVNDWSFDFNVNLSHVANEVIDLEGRDLRTSGIVEGYPMRSFFGYKSNGIIYTESDLNDNPQLAGKSIGDIWLLDIDGYDEEGNLTGEPDGKVNAADRTLIGSKYPDLVYGAMGTVGFKNFTLQVQLQGIQGVDKNILGSGQGVFHYFTQWAMNHDALILDRYHPAKNPTGTMPQVTLADAGKNREFSDFWLDDASYLRIRNINLNYTFDNSLISKLKMSNLGVYVSIQNLYTFTDFHGTEVDTNSDPLTGIPQPRTWTFGLKASF